MLLKFKSEKLADDFNIKFGFKNIHGQQVDLFDKYSFCIAGNIFVFENDKYGYSLQFYKWNKENFFTRGYCINLEEYLVDKYLEEF
jgi:hypothetical protein